MADLNRQILLAARPKGLPAETDFTLVEREAPTPGEGEFLVRTQFVSVDPYLRGLIAEYGSYAKPVGIGEIMPAGAVGSIVQSRHPEYRDGDAVLGHWGWQDYAVSNGEGIERVDTALAPISTALGVLGMPGLTAYFGMLEIGQPKAGESVFVSGAAGAVGSLAGQIARIKGCRVAGSAGSPEKVEYVRRELGFDAAFNYKGEADLTARLREACPSGIDVYFDNVGGPLTDAVFTLINERARIVVSGQIEQYNATRPPRGPRLLWHLIIKRARAEGFLVYQFQDRFAEARTQIAQWLMEGKVTYRETITDGLENTPKAFIGLFQGQNIGKQLVRVS